MSAIHIVFDGPPSHESGRFVEVENENGASISIGEWVDRGDGTWALVITPDADAWDQGFSAGWAECSDPGAFVNDVWDAKTPNPYRGNR